MKSEWRATWTSKLHHELTLSEYVGPFPVGPVGYRHTLATRIGENSGRNAVRGAEIHPALSNPYREDLLFFGNLKHGAVYALDAVTREGVGHIDGGALGVMKEHRGRGAPEEFLWMISQGRQNGDAAVRNTMDYSIGGFKSRVRGHALILNRLEDKTLIPAEVMKDYETTAEGVIVLARDYSPEVHNVFWGISYTPSCVEVVDIDEPDDLGM